MDTYDVALVGYGPVGQLLATLLGSQGHQVLVLERFTAPYGLPRAVHFDDEVARILQRVDLRSDTNPVIEPYDDWYEWRNADRKTLVQVDWRGVGPSWWHTANFFSQPELERELAQRAEKTPGVTVLRGVNVTGYAQGNDTVTLTAVQTDDAGTESEVSFQAKYAIGCDGSNSIIRQLAGLPMHDLGFFFDWLILDMIPNEPMTFDPPAWQLCDPARPTTIVPGGPGRRRWEFMALPGEDVNDLNRADRAWELLDPWGLTADNATLERHTVYRFQARWAEQWRAGRVLIAGDAAHLMPPFAGQGMCAGMRDAYNLAWKLHHVLNGEADDALLDTYGPERSPHVRHFIDFSMQLGSVICVPDPEAAAERDKAMLAAIEDPSLAPPPPLPPRLGPGVAAVADEAAGLLSVQSLIEHDGQTGLFDDILGYGWFILSRSTLGTQLAATQAVIDRLGIRSHVVGDRATTEVDVIDLDGRYTAWFDELGAEAVVVRPDFYVFAACATAGELTTALDGLGLLVPAARVAV
jgi:2-polyprenyl-6-methoxyphenol hydroxylase-like FAD-dependent oxidoreductase